MKFDLPLLDYKMRFSLYQVKMRVILSQSGDYDDALDGLDDDPNKWTESDKRKDRKALSMIQFHLSNEILQEVLNEKSTKALWAKQKSYPNLPPRNGCYKW